MELGMIGLGKMGAFMTERLLRGGHRVVGLDRDPAAVARVVEKGAQGAGSIEKLLAQLKTPRAIWLMVPAGAPVDETIDQLAVHLATGDTIIDGGNSYYKDSVRRAAALAQKKLNFVDCGTSGGVWGLTEGYSMMVGGDDAVVKRLAPIFQTLAPGPEKGWGRVGPAGSGHFVKMVHNGIEYGIMQAYAEGLDLLRHKKEFDLDLLQVSRIWQFGSVIRSWLLDLTVDALSKNPSLEGIG
ncbi:MAG TPA: decarboxylating 6-phosphogluconate dehydrogenase, partial [Candidatus Polarisedimenticolia bacterium]|nr:decarboxylating 6-phosphogluconate dehydrogenase [Candidatus Polarisedimenticolia bacterium]